MQNPAPNHGILHSRTQVYVIPNTFLKETGNITPHIPSYQGSHPFVTVQDSKHVLKTACSQLFTGARILVLGHFAAFYTQLRELAMNPAGPLFIRDVETVD